MVNEALVWAIFLLPLGSFVLIALVIRPFLNRWPFLSALSIIAALTASTVLAAVTLRGVIVHHEAVFQSWDWLSYGGATIQMGLLVDPLTAVMLLVVTSISLLIQIYSVGYMDGDPGFARYFAYMSLFTASMLGLVLSSNIVQLYAFWELVGVSSYLLIGFWHERPSAAAAAKKAFIVTRIGDVGFLIAILYLFLKADDFAAVGLNAFHIPDIWQAAQPVAAGAAVLGGAALTWMALGIFAGAVGKSGQFPLHAWLPDAMEGPTPVSALIHAATMVAAGVFLVARFFPVFQQSDAALAVVALVGAFTALMAATMGLVMNDIKRVMAYSTVSQLGLHDGRARTGGLRAAIFHLVTHAVFKALLFLGAGSVNHASGTFDMTYMGGLRKYMPATYILVMVASFSLIGIIPLAGFWSKDEILLAAFDGNSNFADWINIVTFVGLIVGVVFTAFYSVRMVMMTFHGEFKGGVDQENADLYPQQQAAACACPASISARVTRRKTRAWRTSRRRAPCRVAAGDGGADGSAGLGRGGHRLRHQPAVDQLPGSPGALGHRVRGGTGFTSPRAARGMPSCPTSAGRWPGSPPPPPLAERCWAWRCMDCAGTRRGSRCEFWVRCTR